MCGYKYSRLVSPIENNFLRFGKGVSSMSLNFPIAIGRTEN